MFLRYDYSNMIGAAGLTAEMLESFLPKIKKIRADIFSRSGQLGFLETIGQNDLLLIEKLARKIRKSHDTLLVIGIGGSDLGTRSIYDALISAGAREKKGIMRLRFLGNTDPEEAADVLSDIDWRKTVVNVVSKSGGTAEILANFFLARKLLEKSLGVKRAARQIVATTDPNAGLLRQMAEENGWATLPVPSNIGGRFSALSAVGLFPAACAGIKIRNLLAGSRKVIQDEKKADMISPAAVYAAWQYLAYKSGLKMSVLMPYAASLLEFAVWYRQLWAESLGKTDAVGPTPIAALGAVDQHSQLQLYQDGPKDKVITFLETEKFRKNLQVPTYVKSRSAAFSVQGHSFERIIHAEREATASALFAAGRPNGTIFVSKISEESVGALMQFFMMSVSYLGDLFEIDAFNQPGVEAMKKNLVLLLQGQEVKKEAAGGAEVLY